MIAFTRKYPDHFARPGGVQMKSLIAAALSIAASIASAQTQ
jgi:hypothetical protein